MAGRNSCVERSWGTVAVAASLALLSTCMRTLGMFTVILLHTGLAFAAEQDVTGDQASIGIWRNVMNEQLDRLEKRDNRRIPYVLAIIEIARGLAERGDKEVAREVLRQVTKAIPSSQSPATFSTATVYEGLSQVYSILGDVREAVDVVKDLKYPYLAIDPMVIQWAQNAGHLCDRGNTDDGLAFISKAENSSKRLPEHLYFIEETAEIALAYTKCEQRLLGREFFKRAKSLATQIPFCLGDRCGDWKAMYLGRIDQRIVKSIELDLLTLDDLSKQPNNTIAAAIRLSELGRPQEGLDLLVSLEESRTGRYMLRYESEQYKLEQEKIAVKHARALIAAFQGDNVAAENGFKAVYEEAKAHDGRSFRDGELVRLAASLARLNRCEFAARVLADARSLQEAALMNVRGPGRREALKLLAEIARTYAVCRMDHEALETARFFLRSADATRL